MKLYIYNEEDRLKVAAVLVKNGYKVCQGREKRTPTGKSYAYFIEAEEKTEEVKKGES